MVIAKGHMEDTGEVWYGLVNRNADAAAKISSGYTPAELELFNKAVSVCISRGSFFGQVHLYIQWNPSNQEYGHLDSRTHLTVPNTYNL